MTAVGKLPTRICAIVVDARSGVAVSWSREDLNEAAPRAAGINSLTLARMTRSTQSESFES